ncbi:hypothetical protein GOV12_06270 [Candidatus Pacearchaeota archaeon]|nr:hypothetical protein [Candidatus Pacearchaeota archaeon]
MVNKIYVAIGMILIIIGSLSFIYGSMIQCTSCDINLSVYFTYFGIILFGVGIIVLVLNLLLNRKKLKKFENELKKELKNK